jgi:hypothetical protein
MDTSAAEVSGHLESTTETIKFISSAMGCIRFHCVRFYIHKTMPEEHLSLLLPSPLIFLALFVVAVAVALVVVVAVVV